jgi:branched-chain amino acid transport system permease protein
VSASERARLRNLGGIGPWALLLAAACVPLVLTSNYTLQLVDLALINLIAVIGLNFISGLTGQISFAQAAFAGIGAYASALMLKAGVPFPLALPCAALSAGLCSLLLGIPTLRLRSYYLAMATIGFGEIVRLVFVNWTEVTGGTSGMRNIPPIAFGPVAVEGNLAHYYLFVGLVAVAMLLAARIERSAFGRAMIATRDSETAAQLLGIDTVRVKLLAFFLSAFYAGVAGALYGSYIAYISPDQFSGAQAVLLFTMLVVGGSGRIAGAALGTLALSALPEALRVTGEWYLVIYGCLVIAFIVLVPSGLVGLMQMGLRRLDFAHVLFGKPAPTPDQVQGRLFPEHAPEREPPQAKNGTPAGARP